MAVKNAKKGAPETQPAHNKHDDFVLKYKNTIIAEVVALIAIIVGIIFYNNHKSSQLKAAQAAMQVPELSMELAMNELQQAASLFGENNFAQALNGDSIGTSKGFLKIAD